MAVVVGHGVVPIRPDFGADFHRNIQREGTKATDGLTKQFGGAFRNIAKLAGGMFIGAQVVDVFKGAFKEAQEAQKIGRLTEQAIKSTGGAAKITAKEIGQLSTAISNKAAMDDEAIQTGANLLLTFTKVRNEAGKNNDVFNQTVGLAADMAAALPGATITSATMQLGKALQDPIKGVTALTRAGVSFDDQQKAQIKTLVESGDMLGAQKIILKEVGVQFGGAAAAAADPVEKLKVVWGNLLEDLGTRGLPMIEGVATFLGRNLPDALDRASRAFNAVADPVVAVFKFFQRFPEALIPIGAAILGVVVPALVIKATAVWANVTAWWALNSAIIVAAAPFIAIGLVIAALVAGVIYAYKNFEGFRNVVDAVARVVKDVAMKAFEGLVMLWENVLLPAIQKLASFFVNVLWPAVQTAWDAILAVVRFAWENVLKPIFAIIQWYVEHVLVNAFKVWKFIVVDLVIPLIIAIIKEAWDIIRPIFDAISWVITNAVVPAFQSIWTVVSTVWGFIRPVFEEIVKFVVEKLTPVWQGIAGAVAMAFNAIPGLIGAALRLVGGIVAGFLDGVGGIADAIGLGDIAKVLRNGAGSARGWGQGGPATRDLGAGQQLRNQGGPIYGPNVDRDIVPAMLTPGEFVMRRGAVQKYGAGFMEMINAGRYRTGGLIPGIPDIDLKGLADGVVDKARDVGTSALDRVWPRMDVGGGAFSRGGLPAGGANYLRDAVIKLIRGKEAAMGSQSGGGFTRSGGGGPAGRYTAGMERARAAILNLYGPMSVGGYANRNIAGTNQRSAHGMWRAWDFMTGKNVAKGNAVSKYLIDNASQYGLKGLIWNAQKNFGSGWQPYRHPGGGTNDTLMHRDHVHAEFFNKGGLVHLKNFDGGGTVAPGWNAIRNDTGRDEHLIPRGAGPLVGVVNLHNREDVDEFWRRAEFASMAGRL